ncbi:MAG: hypothetical protein PUG75_02325, partial [Prevotella sp.]|nr:hypothetical protein [Prevotella sp.]
GVRWCGRSNERPYCQGWIIACVTYYSLVLACEAGTRRGHYSGYSLLVLDCGRSNERPYG